MNKIQEIYEKLIETYGHQGWWPLFNSQTGKSEYGVGTPRDEADVFEICIGSILTQNTAWVNVEKALKNLKRINALNLKNIKKLSIGKLREMIKPAGYFNQKANYIRGFIEFYEGLSNIPSREELLKIKGIGPETADSILLYAYRQPVFVVDAYTKRIFMNLGIIQKNASYDEIQMLFMDNLKQDHRIFNEYHALIVEHAKRYYTRKSDYNQCPLLKKFKR